METAQTVEVMDEKCEVLVLGTSELRIRAIGEKTKGLVISDNKTFESVKQARTEMVTVRTSINKARISANQIHRDGISDNDLQAKSLTEIAAEYEEPLQTQVKNWQNKKEDEKRVREEAEKTRKADHADAIDVIRNLSVTHVNTPIEQLQDVIDHYSALEITEDVFEEYAIEAQQVLKNTLLTLDTMIQTAKNREAEAERNKVEQTRLAELEKKLDEQRAEQNAEHERLKNEREALEKKQRDADQMVESENQAYEENALRDRQTKEHEQRVEALRPDKEKLIALADQIDDLDIPDVASHEGGLIIEGALVRLVATVSYIQQQCDDL